MAGASEGEASAGRTGAAADGVGSQSEKGTEGSAGLAAAMAATAADQSASVAGWPGGGATKVEMVGCWRLSPRMASRAALMSSLVSSGSGRLAQSAPGMGVNGEGGKNRERGEGGFSAGGGWCKSVSRGSRSARVRVALRGTPGVARGTVVDVQQAVVSR